MKTTFALIALIAFSLAFADQPRPPPVIDMHMHARVADHYGPSPPPLCAPFERMPFWDPAEPVETGLTFGDALPCEHAVYPATTDEAVLSQTLTVMERHNIYSVLGGSPELVASWMAAAPGRFIPGLDFRLDRATGSAAPGRLDDPYEPMSPEDMRALYERGGFQVLGEVLNQFGGITPADERMAPYWALAEELDIPVGIHIGPGGPAEFYFGNRGYRASLQSVLTLEEVLVRHPRLRVYIMHAGYPFLDDLIALLFSHPQVYVEVSMLVNVEPRAGFYRYLQGIVDAGYIDRVMFGSDQMIWPGIIEPAIQSIQNAPFLSDQQKRDIFYNNAARFLRLSEEEIARHHGAHDALAKGGETSEAQTEAIHLDIGGGIELAYVEQGRGEPVVLIHGSLADYSYWQLSDQISLLSERHRVIAYSRRYNYPNRNLRGENHSPMVEAADLIAFLEALDVAPAHIVGHSYGAYTALAFALDHPERVRSLVLAEPPIISWLPDIAGGEGIHEGFMAGVWEPLAQAFRSGGDAEGLDFTARWYFQSPFAEIKPEWQTLFTRNVDEWQALAVSDRTFPKLEYDRVQAMDVPTLLLSGGANEGFNRLVDGHLMQLLPHVEQVTIPDASHEMFLDDREASARAMLEFFKRNQGLGKKDSFPAH